jgi:hypothetical protein
MQELIDAWFAHMKDEGDRTDRWSTTYHDRMVDFTRFLTDATLSYEIITSYPVRDDFALCYNVITRFDEDGNNENLHQFGSEQLLLFRLPNAVWSLPAYEFGIGCISYADLDYILQKAKILYHNPQTKKNQRIG